MNRVQVGAESVTTAFDEAAGSDTIFVCAHGAGGSIADRGTLASAKAMREAGISAVRFNFLYKEKGSSRPDPMPRCMGVISSVVAAVRAEYSPARILIGGRSMGGRAASMLAAEGFDADGLLLLAYPLHPPGRPEKLRTAHLPNITMPVIAFSGTRDPMCTRSIMEDALKTVKAPWDMHWVETADHSFHVLKSSGQTDSQVMANVGATSRAWIDSSLSNGKYRT